MSTQIEISRTMDVPVRAAYDQWTQFEDMKLFMDGVESVQQVTDDVVRATYKRRGVERTWDARITEQIPDARIAWESTQEQPEHRGVVTFHRIDDSTSKLVFQMEFQPHGFFEQYADKVGLVRSYVEDAVDAFVAFIEDRKRPTGSWRGVVGRDDLNADTERRADHRTDHDADRDAATRTPQTATADASSTGAGSHAPAQPTTSTAPPPPPAPEDRRDVPDAAPTASDHSDARTSHAAGDASVRTMADGEVVTEDEHAERPRDDQRGVTS